MLVIGPKSRVPGPAPPRLAGTSPGERTSRRTTPTNRAWGIGPPRWGFVHLNLIGSLSADQLSIPSPDVLLGGKVGSVEPSIAPRGRLPIGAKHSRAGGVSRSDGARRQAEP